jgi:hypothetical protein
VLRTGFRIVVLAIAVLLLSPRVLCAAPAEVDLDAEVAAGADTNPLELSREVLPGEAIPSGMFTQVSAGGRLAAQWTARAGWFAAAQGRGRFHPARFDEADSSSGRLEAGLGFVLWTHGERRLSAAVRGAVGAERSTFVDPASGGIYLAGDPNAPQPIPDRFDLNATTVGVDLRLRTSSRLLFLLDSSLARHDYRQDYDEVPGVDSLDGRSLLVRPAVRWDVTDIVRLDVTGEWGAVRYDELPSLDESAAPVEDAPRSYRSGSLRAALRVEPSSRWSFSAGVGTGRRDDVHAGYYDSQGDTAHGSVTWSPVEGLRASLRLSQAQVDYRHATVDNTVNGDLRGGNVLATSAIIEKDLFEHLTVRAQAARVQSSNRDPLYTYDRTWALLGLRYAR